MGDRRREVPKEHKYLIQRYTAAKQRCTNPNDARYEDYGGRGIEFRFSSAAEYATYMLSLPGASKANEIDRIDNDGHYEIGNLRWASRAEQTRNTRRTRRVTYDNKEMVWQDFVDNYTDLSVSRADILLSRGYSLEDLTKYKPSSKGRRAQNLRLDKLRT